MYKILYLKTCQETAKLKFIKTFNFIIPNLYSNLCGRKSTKQKKHQNKNLTQRNNGYFSNSNAITFRILQDVSQNFTHCEIPCDNNDNLIFFFFL